MSLSRESILEALRSVRYPGFDRDIVAAGVVREIFLEGGRVGLTLDAGRGDPSVLMPIERDVRRVLQAQPGVTNVEIRASAPAAAAPVGDPALQMADGSKPGVASGGALDTGLIPGVRRTLAVASGKGGVGKSTVAVNLAVAMAQQGSRVGLLDADVYGPSIPLMMGIDADPTLGPEHKLIPFERFGVRVMSLGFLVAATSAVIWRGPMVMKAIEQLLRDVDWGDLDVLVVDMPPGTGDAQLTLSQKVQLAGALIVTTPQDIALADAIRGVAMFRKVDVPVLGLVENMSYFECPRCQERTNIFGHGGGRSEAERLQVPFLAEIPLHASIRSGGDTGAPVVAQAAGSAEAQVFERLAMRVLETLFAASPSSEEAGAPGSQPQ
jgi:ATP-binding protein involved in chromosome partitioning